MTDSDAHPIRLVIVAEICFYREGLAHSFAARGGFEVVGTAEDVEGAVALARAVRFDVALVDVLSPCALESMGVLKGGGGIVALGVREDEAEVIPLAQAGVSGFVARAASLDELALAVTTAAGGEARCSGRIASMLVHRVATLSEQLPERPEIPLTRRQLEIVRLIDEGLPNKAIAQRLFIAVPTVKNHVHSILERLGVDRREDAAPAVRRLAAGALPR